MKAPHELFAELQGQFGRVVPDMAKAARDDLEQHVRALVSSALGKLDLVTREEFDAQSAVLLRTREKVEALETRVAELESALARSEAS